MSSSTRSPTASELSRRSARPRNISGSWWKASRISPFSRSIPRDWSSPGTPAPSDSSAIPKRKSSGQQLAILFTPEDRAAGVPEQEIATAAAKGRSSDERWHQRKDGGRFFASGVLTPDLRRGEQAPGFHQDRTRYHRAQTSRRGRPRGGRPAQGDRRDRRRWHHHDRRARD